MAASDQVQELRERKLGLSPPAPPGGVGEERVLDAKADPALAALALDAAERHQVCLAGERRQRLRRGVDRWAEPEYLRCRAVNARRL